MGADRTTPNAVPLAKNRVRPERHEMTYELTLAADHPVDEAELLKAVYDLDGIYAGSARARRVGWSRL